MRLRRFLPVVILTLASATASCGESQQSPFPQDTVAAAVGADTMMLIPGRIEVAFGDLPEIRTRGFIRVLVSYSRTNYFVDQGMQHGFEYELLKQYEKAAAKQQRRRFEMIFLPVPFDRLLEELNAGRGDIAAAGITMTDERSELVAFSDPYLTGVKEVVVGNAASPPIHSLDDLAGATVAVVRGSSYATHLRRVSDELVAKGLDPIVIEPAPAYIESEDLLDMVSSNLIPYTVVDNHIAELWIGVLDGLVAYYDSPIETGGSLAWAVRKSDTELLTNINAFVKKNKKGSLMGNILFDRYYEENKWAAGQSPETREKLALMQTLLEKYADRYEFDWILLAALAYQESRLEQETVSHAGAVGVFQVLPTTAAAHPINIDDVTNLENNIHAGVKYLDFIRTNYFQDEGISEAARRDFMLASYNAGPTGVGRFRSQAPDYDLDPNRWFGNVERRAGRETIKYVANINKYYYAFRLGLRAVESKQQVRSEMER